MDSTLFFKAISVAQSASVAEDRVSFVAATRVAQSTVPDRQRIVRLLDAAIIAFPSAKSQRIIKIVADHASHRG
jgi:hypothetical protein